MICGILKGGLGNQLFQYAATRNLAHLKNTHFTFDTTELLADKKRTLSVQHFFDLKIETGAESKSNIATQTKSSTKIIERLNSSFKPWYTKQYIKEREGESLKVFPKFPTDCILDGYWQNEGFFKEIEVDLRKEFNIANNPLLQNYVAVHFRGGDYFDNDKRAYHGIASEMYYLRAFEHVKKKFPNVIFHLFSDTPQYFHFDFLEKYQTVWQPVLSDVEDLRKMATYKNFIIANSSFSWWAAWIGAGKDGLVVCPSLWYKHKKLKKVNPTLKEWTQLTPW